MPEIISKLALRYLMKMIGENDELARLAHEFWVDRGRPSGSPEVDWARAEQELWNRTAQDEQRTATHSHSEGGVTGGWSETAQDTESNVPE